MADLMFVGGGVLASIAWAWLHSDDGSATPENTCSPEVKKPRTDEYDHPPMPGEMVAPPTPKASPSARPRPEEFGTPPPPGGIRPVPKTE